jgi:hypothetical protein
MLAANSEAEAGRNVHYRRSAGAHRQVHLAENYGTHTVYAVIGRKEGEKPLMRLIGADHSHQLFSRSMPINILLTRVGDAVCPPMDISGRQNGNKTTSSATD